MLLGLRVLLLSLVYAAGAPPKWPNKFSVNITTNHTWRVTDQSYTVSGKMYYNWDLKALRVDHGPGNFECSHFYQSQDGCSLVHLPTGTYRILPQPLPAGQPACCRDTFLAQIGAPPPDWAESGHPSAQRTIKLPYTGYEGVEYRYASTGNCTNRTSGDNSGCHTYVARSEQGLASPLLFSFPANHGLQDWYYLAPTQVINDTAMPDSMFELPEGCNKKDCPNASPKRVVTISTLL